MDKANSGALQLAKLATQLQQLTQVVSHLHTQQQATTATVPPPRCPVNPPEKFSENMVEFPAFLAQWFLTYFLSTYANTQQAATANRKIRALKQGKSSVASYFTEFQLLAQDLAWNEIALMDQYVEGLTDKILDELA
ncbi:UNVERIFIED_CONTAM: hypothetical protein K2H54_055332 [Gekko kuhli]